MKPVVILGTGGNCIDILDCIRDLNATASSPLYEPVGFLDDDPKRHDATLHGVPVVGSLPRASELTGAWFINGIGSSSNFLRKPGIIAAAGIPVDRFVTVVHPTAHVSALAAVGRGVVILQNSVVGSGARIGDHVMILPLSVVSHDAIVGDYSIIAGGVCLNGAVSVGRCCYIGSGTQVRDGIRIGDESLCGMGANVIRDVESRTVVAGNPARVLRRL